LETIFPDGRPSAFSKPAVRVFAAANQDIPDCGDQYNRLFGGQVYSISWFQPNTGKTDYRLNAGPDEGEPKGGLLPERKMKNMSFQLMLILILVSLAAIFIIQNVAAVEVSFLFWSIAMSRALLIVFALVIGFVSGWIVHGYLALWRSKERSADSA